MSSKQRRPPQLLGFVWFFLAAGFFAGAFFLEARGYSESLGFEKGQVFLLAQMVGCMFIGMGIGEWRGLRYADYVRSRASSTGS